MKKIIFLTVVISIYFPRLESQADTGDDFALKTFGIGIGLQQNYPYWTYWAPASKFLFIVNVNEVWRFEPEIGFSRDQDHRTDSDRSNTDYILGINNYLIVKRNRICFLPGLKTSFIKSKGYYKEINEPKIETESNSFLIGPLMGVEYYFAKYFSVGGELGFLYKKQKSLKTWDGDDHEGKQTMTSAVLKFRFYF